jgi:hypothetical protein
MGSMRPLGRLALLRAQAEVIADVDPPDHQDPVLGVDLARSLGPESPPPAGIPRASSAPPRVPVSQPAEAATT